MVSNKCSIIKFPTWAPIALEDPTLSPVLPLICGNLLIVLIQTATCWTGGEGNEHGFSRPVRFRENQQVTMEKMFCVLTEKLLSLPDEVICYWNRVIWKLDTTVNRELTVYTRCWFPMLKAAEDILSTRPTVSRCILLSMKRALLPQRPSKDPAAPGCVPASHQSLLYCKTQERSASSFPADKMPGYGTDSCLYYYSNVLNSLMLCKWAVSLLVAIWLI